MLVTDKHLLMKLLVGFVIAAQICAATADIAERYLDKADAAYENGDVNSSYKYINEAMLLTKQNGIPANIICLILMAWKLRETKGVDITQIEG